MRLSPSRLAGVSPIFAPCCGACVTRAVGPETRPPLSIIIPALTVFNAPGVRKIFITIIYCLGVLGFFEATARVVLWSDTAFSRIVPWGDSDSTSRLLFIRRYSEKSPIIYYPFDVYHPTRGWALRPRLSRVEAFANKTLSSNSRGLRGSSEHTYEKQLGIQRILAFGDSFTFGDEVSDDETWTYFLEKLLPGSEVINFGVHGYGHDQMLLYLREEGIKYRPDIVMLGFVSEDMERNMLSFRDYAKPRFVLDGGRLVLTNTPVPRIEETLAREPWRSKFLDVLTMLRDRYRKRFGELELKTEMKQVTIALLDEIANTIRVAGAVPIFVYLPIHGEITSEKDMSDGERFFFSYCRERGIQAIYLQRFFHEKLERGVALKTTGHWGPVEHRTAAEGIRAHLFEHNVIPLSQPAGAIR
jgi:hypothetical protein